MDRLLKEGVHQGMFAHPHLDEPKIAEQTWRMLWSHAAQQIVSACSDSCSNYESVTTGVGWGFRHPQNPRRALLVHPTGLGRDVGDLAVTVLGSGTHVVPRCGLDFGNYVDAVAEIVEITALSCLAD